MIRRTFLILVIVIVGIFLHVKGIDWGVPKDYRIDLVFGEIGILNDMVEPMLSTHMNLREMQIYYGAEYPPDYDTSKEMLLNIKGVKKKVSIELINSMRSYLLRSYGADEQAVLSSLSKMNPSKMDFNPHFFEYGGVYLYLLGCFLKICSLFDMVELKSDIKYYFFYPGKMGDLYKFSRLFGAIFFIFSAIFFYFLCLKITKDEFLSFLISLLFVSTPGFALWSHYLKPYTYGLFYVVCCLYFNFKYIDEKRVSWLVLSSCFAGFAMGSLLSYGFVILAVICAIILFCIKSNEILKNIILCCASFVLAYLITNPYVLISWHEFINEIHYIGSYWKNSASFENLKYFSTVSLKYGLGLGIWLISILYFFISLLNFDKRFLLVLLCLVPFFVYFGLNTGKWVHYAFIIYPFIFLVIAIGATLINKKLSLMIFSFVFVWTFVFTLSHVNLFEGENIRAVAGRWINENIPARESVGLLEAPSPWRTPPFQYLKYNILIGSPEKTMAQYYVISEYQWVRGSSLLEMRKLFADYDIVKEFSKQPAFLGWKFTQRQDIPYDWCHPNPVILIWKKRN
ncbi:MAG: glycosyltransferase family 39 protein [Candidatus Omnitrophica bacterium]|nr:glycosyltransferase family 39 protein [Candidatus Omnitrophota bacterium]